eukprot:TRINITY_DN6720_c0_g1_i2.p1 TRINITY_DN6720_c0_g1~~TRINITY_DN6720_c0_g1_i2.p1  ORF type:complete len:961 (+),score=295.08 TRINITY_DN6720_c0_g1_i2:157-3039(+)
MKELNLNSALEVISLPMMILKKLNGENLLPHQKFSISQLNPSLTSLLASWSEDSMEDWKERLVSDLRFTNELEFVLTSKNSSLILISFEENFVCNVNLHPFKDEILCIFQTNLNGEDPEKKEEDSLIDQKVEEEKVEKIEKNEPKIPENFSISASNPSSLIHLTKKRKQNATNPINEEPSSYSSLTDSDNDLQEHIGLFYNLAECVPHLTWMASADGVPEYFNQKWYDYTGQHPSDTKGHSWGAALHPDDSIRTFETWTGCLTTGREYDITYRIKSEDGHFEWFEGKGSPYRDKRGRIVKWFGTCTNVDKKILAEKQRGEAEVKLREMTNRYQKLTESELVGVFVEEKADGRIVDANSVFSKVFGMKPEEEDIFRSNLSVPCKEDEEKKKELEETGVNRTYESTFKDSNGKTFQVLLGTTTLNDHQYLSVFIDISAQKHAEKMAIEATKAKSSFIANISHEIRTPLNGVCGMTELLFDSQLDSNQRESVNIIKKSSEMLLVLINNILDFSKLDVGKMKLEKSEFDVQNVVEDIIDLLGEGANSKGIELLYSVKGVDSLVRGDHGRLRQILINLINNAIKFTDSGEVVVEVELESRFEDKSKLKFKIKDSGIGITNEDMKDLFKPFVQLDNSLSRSHTGTGLGLTICRQLVELFDGEVGAESEPGKGSTFWFTIVVESSPRAKSTLVLPSALDNYEVMVSVNNTVLQQNLMDSFNSWSVKSVSSFATPDALQLLREKNKGSKIEVVFADSKNGFEIAKAIESHPNSNRSTKLVLIGSNPLCIQSSCITSFLPKPLKQSKVFDALMRALSQQPEKQSVNDANSLNLEEPPEEWSNLTVLLVEDNAINVRVASRQLEKLGINRIVVAGNGVEALSLLEKSRAYSIIFMDCQMPIMDGITATKEIRRREQFLKWEHIPIVAMTANVLNEAVSDCINAGMNDFITKPVKIEHLGKTLRKWCSPKP